METELPTPVIDNDDDDDNDDMQLFEEENDEPANPLDEAVEVPAPNEAIKPKRVIKNPQPKLDSIRLMGPRGVGILQSTFKDVKFRGKGYEKEDLRLLMKKLEHWAHRLFPKFPFDDTLKQIEKLGSKKPVQNMVKRIRLDMFQSDELNDENKENNDDANIDDKEPEVDVFDQLLSTGPYAAEQSSKTVANEVEIPSSTLPSSQSITPVSLTEEQREKIARKRLEALERRRKRLLEQETKKEISISENAHNSVNFPGDDAAGKFGSKKRSLEENEDKMEDCVESSTDKMDDINPQSNTDKIEDDVENSTDKMEEIGSENITDKMEVISPENSTDKFPGDDAAGKFGSKKRSLEENEDKMEDCVESNTDKMDDINPQSNTDKIEDDVENSTDKKEDIGTENITDKMEVISAENSTDKNKDIGAENCTDKMKDIGAKNNTDMMEVIGVKNSTDMMEVIGAENSTEKIENIDAQNSTDMMKDIGAKISTNMMEDIGAKNSTKKMEDIGTENGVEEPHLKEQNPLVSLKSTQSDENSSASESKKLNSDEESNDVEMVTEDDLLGLIS